eukprot:scpid92875/ scgid16938/ 
MATCLRIPRIVRPISIQQPDGQLCQASMATTDMGNNGRKARMIFLSCLLSEERSTVLHRVSPSWIHEVRQLNWFANSSSRSRGKKRQGLVCIPFPTAHWYIL